MGDAAESEKSKETPSKVSDGLVFDVTSLSTDDFRALLRENGILHPCPSCGSLDWYIPKLDGGYIPALSSVTNEPLEENTGNEITDNFLRKNFPKVYGTKQIPITTVSCGVCGYFRTHADSIYAQFIFELIQKRKGGK